MSLLFFGEQALENYTAWVRITLEVFKREPILLASSFMSLPIFASTILA
jgi:hypothetical protein